MTKFCMRCASGQAPLGALLCSLFSSLSPPLSLQRVLDFAWGLQLTDYLRNLSIAVEFIDSSTNRSEPLFKAVSFAGFVGVLTGESAPVAR